jgi:hypothetical protein
MPSRQDTPEPRRTLTADASVSRDDILAAVRGYAQGSLVPAPFVPGETTVPVSGKVLDAEDIACLVDSSLDGWLTSGRFTAGRPVGDVRQQRVLGQPGGSVRAHQPQDRATPAASW